MRLSAAAVLCPRGQRGSSLFGGPAGLSTETASSITRRAGDLCASTLISPVFSLLKGQRVTISIRLESGTGCLKESFAYSF